MKARTARASVGGICDHALNRGNRRETVFHKPADYDAFLGAMADASVCTPMDVLGYCLMPNHFHLVLRPHADGDLSHGMQWLLTAHARRYHRHYKTTGHVWQGRFKAFPIEADEHLLTVMRYVERNPLRAELVPRAEDWSWSSLSAWLSGDGLLWREDPPLRDAGWLERVNEPFVGGGLEAIASRGGARGTVRWGVVDASDGGAIGAGIVPSSSGATEEATRLKRPMSPFFARSKTDRRTNWRRLQKCGY